MYNVKLVQVMASDGRRLCQRVNEVVVVSTSGSGAVN